MNETMNASKDVPIPVALLLSTKGKRINIRKLALDHYRKLVSHIICVYCGFGIEGVLEVAHLNTDRTDNDPSNWAFLCPTCHRMHDLGLIRTDTVREMRDHPKTANWLLLVKDASAKATATDKRHSRSESSKLPPIRRSLREGRMRRVKSSSLLAETERDGWATAFILETDGMLDKKFEALSNEKKYDTAAQEHGNEDFVGSATREDGLANYYGHIIDTIRQKTTESRTWWGLGVRSSWEE